MPKEPFTIQIITQNSRKSFIKYTSMFVDMVDSTPLNSYYNAIRCGLPKLKSVSIVSYLHILIVLENMNRNKHARYLSAPSTDRSILLVAQTIFISAIFAFAR